MDRDRENILRSDIRGEISRLRYCPYLAELDIKDDARKGILVRALRAKSLEDFVNDEMARLMRQPVMNSTSMFNNALSLIRYDVEREVINELHEKL